MSTSTYLPSWTSAYLSIYINHHLHINLPVYQFIDILLSIHHSIISSFTSIYLYIFLSVFLPISINQPKITKTVHRCARRILQLLTNPLANSLNPPPDSSYRLWCMKNTCCDFNLRWCKRPRQNVPQQWIYYLRTKTKGQVTFLYAHVSL